MSQERKFKIPDAVATRISAKFGATLEEIKLAEAKLENKITVIPNDLDVYQGFVTLQLHVPVLIPVSLLEVE